MKLMWLATSPLPVPQVKNHLLRDIFADHPTKGGSCHSIFYFVYVSVYLLTAGH